MDPSKCAYCAKPLPTRIGKGGPRRYCPGRSCREKAYRSRLVTMPLKQVELLLKAAEANIKVSKL